MKPPDGYITPKHAARAAGVHIATMFRWIYDGHVASARTDHPARKRQHVFVCRESLDAFLHTRAHPAKNQPIVAEKPRSSAWAKAFLASRGVG